MSEFKISVVCIGEVHKHSNADTLSITQVHGGYPCIFRTGEFKPGDLAVYIPVDSKLPNEGPFTFLSDSDRKCLRAKRLRGIFSMGLLVPAPVGAVEGDDLREHFGITKWEPSVELSTYGDNESGPKGWEIPVYTDIEGFRRWPLIFSPGEHVVLTEKLHGANGRFVHDGERLWCGSRTGIKKDYPTSPWWEAARHAQLEDKLSKFPMMIFYGEVFGQVQDLKYGHRPNDKPSFAVFDIFSVKDGRYLDHQEAWCMVQEAGLSWVPILEMGPWEPELTTLSEGQSHLGDNVREGFVIKPLKERFSEEIGRVILKMHGQGYLLRKKK